MNNRKKFFSLRRLAQITVLCGLSWLSACTRRGDVTHIKVEMKKYELIPNTIRLRQGSNVVLDVNTLDVQHGFYVPDLNIKEPIQPGKPAAISIPTDRRGDFKIVCGIICGPMHDDMTGNIVVE